MAAGMSSLMSRSVRSVLVSLVSTRGPGVSVLADGCAQLARDLRIPTQLSQLGVQVSTSLMASV